MIMRQNTDQTPSPFSIRTHNDTGHARGAGGRQHGEEAARGIVDPLLLFGGQATRGRPACRLLGSRRKKEGGEAGAYTGLAGTQLRVVPHLSEESERTQGLLLT